MNVKIDKNNIEDILNLTHTQEGMLFHYIKDISTQYHEQLSLAIEGDLDITIMQSSWNHVIKTNEMLRTIFRWKNIDRPVQIVLKNHKVDIKYYDFSLLDKNQISKEISKIKEMDLNKKIDITQETIRVILCKLDIEKYEMIISNHHILYDGWSNANIYRELLEAYNTYNSGNTPILLRKTKYKTFVKESQKQIEGTREFWNEYLHDYDSNSYGFFNGTLPENDHKANVKVKISKEISERVKAFAKNNKISMASIYYAAWAVMLQRLNNNDDIAFGTVISGRDIETNEITDIENMVGLFINTVPFRIKLDSSSTFENLINKVDKLLKARSEYTRTSLVEIKEYAQIKQTDPLFNSIVVIENYPLELQKKQNNDILQIKDFKFFENNNYNMTITILDLESIELYFNFNTSVVSKELVSRIGQYISKLLHDLPNECITLPFYNILSDSENSQLNKAIERNSRDFDIHETIATLFENQVNLTPKNIAVVFEKEEINYEELNKRADTLSNYLKEKGLQPNTIVGIYADRSIEVIVAILGILKAGGAYLPLDSNLPDERLDFMINDSQTPFIVTNKENNSLERLKFRGEIIKLCDLQGNRGIIPPINKKINNSNGLAYVMYTSGSTGTPKGVMVEHRQLLNFIEGINDKTNLSKYQTILCVTSFSFDIFFLESLLPLTKGMKVVFANSIERDDPWLLGKLIVENEVQIIQNTPSRIKLLIDNEIFTKQFNNIKMIFIGGEELNDSLYKVLSSISSASIFNMYGPTETTIWSTIKELKLGEKPNIGKPIQNTQVFILDKHNNLQPIGVPGELCIAGEGVARGYLNNPELTAEKFIAHPYE
ncbi:non-ribosomal peptide synthetase, partial [Lysinibacillus xylanilyticus]|uniref:non-ribosomal peptide synthetase n=1 Tax=Lysinibacillus xylanilyticus TaxID=582475 RepID=UPI0037F4A78F